jgi:hypothetical protein
MADQIPTDNAQNVCNTQAAAQLAIQPQFSNKLSEGKFTEALGLAKVVNHKEGAQWNDSQTVSHVRNAFKDLTVLTVLNGLVRTLEHGIKCKQDYLKLILRQHLQLPQQCTK